MIQSVNKNLTGVKERPRKFRKSVRLSKLNFDFEFPSFTSQNVKIEGTDFEY